MTVRELIEQEQMTYEEVLEELVDMLGDECGVQGCTLAILKRRSGDGTCEQSFANVQSMLAMTHVHAILQVAHRISKEI